MAKKINFPKTIHVTHEGEGEAAYYNVTPHGLPDVDQTTAVAIYELREVGEVEVTREFKPGK